MITVFTLFLLNYATRFALQLWNIYLNYTIADKPDPTRQIYNWWIVNAVVPIFYDVPPIGLFMFIHLKNFGVKDEEIVGDNSFVGSN